MSEALAPNATPRDQKPTLLAAAVAGQQWGVIGWRQLRDCGVGSSTAQRWRADAKLHIIHRGVYALGHSSIPIEGRLVAALLHAGRDAVLSHATAAWWWGLIAVGPTTIDVSTGAWARSTAGVAVHHRRRMERTRHRRFPITTVPQTLLDLAAAAPLNQVRRALAEADYRRLLDPRAFEQVLGVGRPGSAKLRKALERHQPRLARARSPLEELFIPLCESAGIDLPELNVRFHGWRVDALWRRERLVVELDGYDNHSTPAQIERDRREELQLRAVGFIVVRYSWWQVTDEPELVIADLRARLSERRSSQTARSA
jgi:hypothetical protein